MLQCYRLWPSKDSRWNESHDVFPTASIVTRNPFVYAQFFLSAKRWFSRLDQGSLELSQEPIIVSGFLSNSVTFFLSCRFLLHQPKIFRRFEQAQESGSERNEFISERKQGRDWKEETGTLMVLPKTDETRSRVRWSDGRTDESNGRTDERTNDRQRERQTNRQRDKMAAKAPYPVLEQRSQHRWGRERQEGKCEPLSESLHSPEVTGWPQNQEALQWAREEGDCRRKFDQNWRRTRLIWFLNCVRVQDKFCGKRRDLLVVRWHESKDFCSQVRSPTRCSRRSLDCLLWLGRDRPVTCTCSASDEVGGRTRCGKPGE